jgi:hypothetical protein
MQLLPMVPVYTLDTLGTTASSMLGCSLLAVVLACPAMLHHTCFAVQQNMAAATGTA